MNGSSTTDQLENALGEDAITAVAGLDGTAALLCVMARVQLALGDVTRRL